MNLYQPESIPALVYHVLHWYVTRKTALLDHHYSQRPIGCKLNSYHLAQPLINLFGLFGSHLQHIPPKLDDSLMVYLNILLYLQNGFYAGLAQWNNVEVKEVHPAIINKKLYENAHGRLMAIKPGKAPCNLNYII